MITTPEISALLAQVESVASKNMTPEVYAKCLASVDLTTLTPCDTELSVRELADRAMSFYAKYPDMQNVASICVYPPFVECVGLVVDGTPMRITSVAGGFPDSQTFLEVKALEIAMAIESGADEVDIVIPVGKVLAGDYDEVESELQMFRAEAGEDLGDRTTLKVILETGELKSADKIYDAAMLAMHAGADFIKTSTGKRAISATPEAVAVMCEAIKDYHAESGRMVGVKVAGGIRTAADAVLYYTIVEQLLGEEWLTPEYFRIGASSAANALLSAAVGEELTLF